MDLGEHFCKPLSRFASAIAVFFSPREGLLSDLPVSLLYARGARCPAPQRGGRGTLAFSYGVAPLIAALPVAHNVPVSSVLGQLAA